MGTGRLILSISAIGLGIVSAIGIKKVVDKQRRREVGDAIKKTADSYESRIAGMRNSFKMILEGNDNIQDARDSFKCYDLSGAMRNEKKEPETKIPESGTESTDNLRNEHAPAQVEVKTVEDVIGQHLPGTGEDE